MRKITLVFGLIIGGIFSAFGLYAAARCCENPKFESNDLIGYAGMLATTSLIFIAIKSYRDKHENGFITFGKAFKVGGIISLIASTLYVVAWLIDYYIFLPDFIDYYTQHVLYMQELNGATQAQIDAKAAEMAEFKELYKNPLFVIIVTYAEILPLGLIISLISAALLRKKQKQQFA
ncbi:MAG TPA: DUF4199 domain-containing protein [Chryseosolibacter sp.]